jgi:hypothetical protein
LQALNLLNDPVFVEAAQALAVRVLRETAGKPLDERLQHAFEIALDRPAGPAELEGLIDYYKRQTSLFEQDRASAASFSPVTLPGYSRVETAAWTGVASVILNLDEFITRE